MRRVSRKNKIKVRDLFMMTAGFDYNTDRRQSAGSKRTPTENARPRFSGNTFRAAVVRAAHFVGV
ncbi:MAG: hypothetical protein ACLUSP_04525 [Christensenellales bacterium]